MSSGIRCRYCGRELRVGEPQIVIDFGTTEPGGLDFKDRIWEGHLRCFYEMLRKGELNTLLATLREYLQEYEDNTTTRERENVVGKPSR